MTLVSTATPVALLQRGSGSALVIHTETRTTAGELANEQWVTEFFRGIDAPESRGEQPADHRLPAEVTGTDPVGEIVQAIADDQPDRYADGLGRPLRHPPRRRRSPRTRAPRPDPPRLLHARVHRARRHRGGRRRRPRPHCGALLGPRLPRRRAHDARLGARRSHLRLRGLLRPGPDGDQGRARPAALSRCSSLAEVHYLFADCRWSLDDPELGWSQYLAGHIPGAVFVDVERDLSSPPGPAGRHPLPTPERFARTAGLAGIGPDTFVVAYGSMGGAERLWWLLRHFGHDRCAVIDLDAWRGPLTPGEEAVEPAAFELGERYDDTISLDELAARYEELVVVDARLAPRWRGEPNPIDRVPGRIPGALNAPWPDPLPELPPASSSPTAARGSPPASPSTASTSPVATGASIPARGRSGSSGRSCLANAARRPRRRTPPGSAPSEPGSSGRRAG